MPLTDTDLFLTYFITNGNVLTLGQIMKTHWGCEYRKHISLLRQRRYTIKCEIHLKEPSSNTYRLSAPQPDSLPRE